MYNKKLITEGVGTIQIKRHALKSYLKENDLFENEEELGKLVQKLENKLNSSSYKQQKMVLDERMHKSTEDIIRGIYHAIEHEGLDDTIRQINKSGKKTIVGRIVEDLDTKQFTWMSEKKWQALSPAERKGYQDIMTTPRM